MRRLPALSWRPTSFFGRIVAVALGLCLFAFLLVVSIAAVAIGLAALGVYMGYVWWKQKSIAKGTRAPVVIDVKPEVVDEQVSERDRERR